MKNIEQLRNEMWWLFVGQSIFYERLYLGVAPRPRLGVWDIGPGNPQKVGLLDGPDGTIILTQLLHVFCAEKINVIITTRNLRVLKHVFSLSLGRIN